MKKARFVMYNKPHLYIDTCVQINELHLKQVHYTIMLEDLMKLCGIWEAHDRPSVESRAHDKKHLECLVEVVEAICMEFKAREYKSL